VVERQSITASNRTKACRRQTNFFFTPTLLYVRLAHFQRWRHMQGHIGCCLNICHFSPLHLTAMISFRMSSPLRQIVHNGTQSQRRQAYHNSGWVRGARLGASMMPLQVVTGVIL
jgi:hypothetical protein